MDGVTNIAWIGTHMLLFLALFYLLKKYAFGPVLRLLDERRESIKSQFEEMERMKQEAERMRAEHQEQMQKSQAQARDLVRKSQEDAKRAAEQLKVETQAQLEKARKEASDRIAHETEMARAELRKYVADLTVATAGKFLKEGLTDQQRRTLTEETLPEIERSVTRN